MPISIDRARLFRYGLLILGCLLVVVAIDLVTNELNTTRYYWDFALYYDMAENGLSGNDNLWAPFAYRFGVPLLGGAIADIFSLATPDGFKVIAYAGAVAQLALVFVLAQHFNRKFGGPDARRALVAVAVVALSLYNVKFLIFDVSRPDHLAYPLMVVAVLALFQRQYALLLIASCLGLLTREFLIIPPAILVVVLLRDYRRTHDPVALRWIAVTVVCVGLFVIVPRALIPIQGTGQYIDPVNDSGTLKNLIEAPLSERRNVNMAFNVIAYTLPMWLLLTLPRARRVWARLAQHRLFLGLYSGAVLVLAMYGGTDLWRFMTYLFVPQVIVLAVLLHEDVDPAEVLYMLVVVAVFNKIWRDIPNYHDLYLDFYGGYDNRVNVVTFERLYELAAYGVGIWLLRALLAVARRGWSLRRDPAGIERTRGVSL